MRNIMIGLAALAAVGIAMPVTAANAQDRTVIIKRDNDRDIERPRTTKKVIIKRGDRGNHYGWRNRDRERVVIKRRVRDDNVGFRERRGGSSVTIKKSIDRD